MSLTDAMLLGGGAVAALGAIAGLVLPLRGPAPPDGSKVRKQVAKPAEENGR